MAGSREGRNGAITLPSGPEHMFVRPPDAGRPKEETGCIRPDAGDTEMEDSAKHRQSPLLRLVKGGAPLTALSGEDALVEAAQIAAEHLRRSLMRIPLNDPRRAEIEALAAPRLPLRAFGSREES